MTRAKKSPPTTLVTYLCTRCTWDFSRTELDKPTCTICEKNDKLQEIKREPITPQAIEAGMMRSMERMMVNLEKAYSAGKEEGIGDQEEIMLLEAMVKAKNLQKHVEKAFGKGKTKTRSKV